MTRQALLSICAFVSLGYGSTFVNRPSFHPMKAFTRRQASRRSSMTMYFDDVSRSPKDTIGWTPTGNELAGIGAPVSKEQQKQIDFEAKLANEKLDAIKRLLLGYDAESASLLSEQEVMEQLQLWAEKSGVVGDALGDELYISLLGMNVCTSSTLVGCLAHYWKSIVDVIHEYSDEHNPVDRWTITKSVRPQIFMMAFPNCKELYDYKQMTTLTTATEFCKDLCLHLGKRFSLTLFHPKYKNSPKMLSPARHSPFPCSGLHFEGEDDEFIERLMERAKPRRGYVTNDRNGDDDSVPNLKERRVHLEVLFNSAAASSTADDLTRDTASRNMSQRYPKEVVVEMLKLWIDSNRFTHTDDSSRVVNRALQFADSVEERWHVSESKIAEEVYAEIWQLISDVYEQGGAIDKELVAESKNEKPVSKKISHTDMKTVVPPIKVTSAMFVSTKFCAFNAQSFKRFAITVNAALKRLTYGKMFIEVFHPEYVGNNGYNNTLRRSPFPAIQICYELQKPLPLKTDDAKAKEESSPKE